MDAMFFGSLFEPRYWHLSFLAEIGPLFQ